MGRLDRKVAIVTGAGRGIGRATAKLLAAEGAKVAVLSLTAANLQRNFDMGPIAYLRTMQACHSAPQSKRGGARHQLRFAGRCPRHGALWSLMTWQKRQLTDIGLVRHAIRGSDAVLSALGPTSLRHPRDLPITRGTETMISAMKQEKIERLIAVSTGTAADPGDGFDWKIGYPALLIKYLWPGAYQDILGLASAIRNSELDWTMVRVAVLRRGRARNQHSKQSLTVNRDDVAIFMFDQIADRQFVNKAPGISSR